MPLALYMLFFYPCGIISCDSQWVAPRATFSVFISFWRFGLMVHTIGKPLTTKSSSEVLMFTPEEIFLWIPLLSCSYITNFSSHKAWNPEIIPDLFLFYPSPSIPRKLPRSTLNSCLESPNSSISFLFLVPSLLSTFSSSWTKFPYWLDCWSRIQHSFLWLPPLS